MIDGPDEKAIYELAVKATNRGVLLWRAEVGPRPEDTTIFRSEKFGGVWIEIVCHTPKRGAARIFNADSGMNITEVVNGGIINDLYDAVVVQTRDFSRLGVAHGVLRGVLPE